MNGRAAAFILLAFCVLAVATCSRESGSDARPARSSNSSQRSTAIRFTDVTEECGLDFRHSNGATGHYYIPEIMGPGCALFDYDGDGDLDLYAIQGGPLNGIGTVVSNRLFRNELLCQDGESGTLRFTDVTDEAGVGHTGFGMGAAVGDFDGDGHPDLYVTNFGSNVLYRNNGDGTFTDVTASSHTDDRRFSASAAFLDYDRDGDLDLFVTNYVAFSTATNRECVRLGGQRDYCGPQSYEAVSDTLFQNNGDSTFVDVTATAGIDRRFGYGLGVVCRDFNGDGWIDIFVANDATPNQLWINDRNGAFRDEGLVAGVATNSEGRNEAGMGVSAGDFDGDGDVDLFLTHERGETNTLYRNLGAGHFEDATTYARLASPSLPAVGFGTGWLDFNSDGWLDLFVANGAVRKLASLVGDENPYRQADQLFLNDQGRFSDVSAAAGLQRSVTFAGRGVAFGDVDNDGDTDVVVANNAGPMQLLRNEGGDGAGNWVQIRAVGTRSGHDAYGAHVVLELTDGRQLHRWIGTDGSYLSVRDRRLHFGLGKATRALAVAVHWPRSAVERWEKIPINALTKLTEGETIETGLQEEKKR